MSGIRQHSFQHGARSIIQMGEELIGHPTSAINELVKNGYDADATECYTYVHYDKNAKKSFIIIYDNGLGMEHDTLFGDWLQPSVSAKRKMQRSKIFKRSLLGSKGIGRLAAMALGKHLTVISKIKKERQYNWLSLSKEKFESDVLLNTIKFPGDTISDFNTLFNDKNILKERESAINESLINILSYKPFCDFKQGTLIILEEISNVVNTIIEDDFHDKNENDLKVEDTQFMKGLATLITPLELDAKIQNELHRMGFIDKKKKNADGKNPFSLFYLNNLLPGFNIKKFKYLPVYPLRILEGFDYRVMGRVDEEGNVTGKFTCKRLTKDSFVENFEIESEFIFENSKTNKKEKKEIEKLPETLKKAEVGNFFYDIRVYDREEDSLTKMSKFLNTEGKSETRETLDKLLGLRISKNGFGVKPYGEPENRDWMGLGQLRVQDPGKNVSINQVLGYIFCYSPENDGLREKTNREGFYENKAFIQMKNIMQTILSNIGKKRYNYRLKHNLGRTIKSKHQRPDFKSYIKYVSDNATKAVAEKTKKMIAETTTAMDNLEHSLTFSERLATLGNSVELVYHELAQPIGLIGASTYSMELEMKSIIDTVIKDNLKGYISEIESSNQSLEEIKESLKPAIGLSAPKDFMPINTFQKVCRLFKKDFNDYNISLKIDSSLKNYEIHDNEYSLWISFLNIINNAVYWLKMERKSNQEKELIIYFTKEKNRLVISNTGPLIPDDAIDLIFEYGVTLKKEKSATGLGLTFTKNILRRNNWSIEAENRKEGPAFIIQKK